MDKLCKNCIHFRIDSETGIGYGKVMEKGHLYYKNDDEGFHVSNPHGSVICITFDDLDAIDNFVDKLGRLRDTMEKTNVVDQES